MRPWVEATWFFYQGAAMDRSAIPEDQHFPSDMALEVSEEFDHLRALDAAGMDREIEAPEGQAPMIERLFQLKVSCKSGVCPRGAQVRTRVGRVLKPLSSRKTMVRLCWRALF